MPRDWLRQRLPLSAAKAQQPETPTKDAAAVVEVFLEQVGVRLP